MKKSYGWSWINVVGNATDEFNKNDFLSGKVFWFIDDVTNAIYSVKKDADSRTGINFSGDLLLKLQQNGRINEFCDWLRVTSIDLWNLYKAHCCVDVLISCPCNFFSLDEDEFTVEMADCLLDRFGFSSNNSLEVVKCWFQSCRTNNLDVRDLMRLGEPLKISPNFISQKYDPVVFHNYCFALPMDSYFKNNNCFLADLEDDFEFMASVINLSYDKKMFVFCSDRLKSSYEMVWFMVNRFSDDRSFVTKIVDSYLKVNSDLEDRIAILRLMSNMGFDNYRSLLNSYSCGH